MQTFEFRPGEHSAVTSHTAVFNAVRQAQLMKWRRSVVSVLISIVASMPAMADGPRDAWVQAKCAVCHGIDGSSRMMPGQRIPVPDLRAPAIQKRTDEELAKGIAEGHKRMPSFKKAITVPKTRLLVAYIRSLAPAPAKTAKAR
jgi:cytochrome c553